MDGRDEAACDEAKKDGGGEVMGAKAVTELKVLGENCAEGKGDRLWRRIG